MSQPDVAPERDIVDALAAQVMPLVTPWQGHFLVRVLLATWYRPVGVIEVDTALLLSRSPYHLLDYLEHSGKYRLSLVGMVVVKHLTA